ncbi:hypothetical protein ACFWJM_08685, partial [Streptomyces sp. NPDC127077]
MSSDFAPCTRHLRIHQDHGHVVLELHGEIDLLATTEITPLLDAVTSDPAPAPGDYPRTRGGWWSGGGGGAVAGAGPRAGAGG